MKRFSFQTATVVCAAVLSACSVHRHAPTKPVHCTGDGAFKQQWESVKVVRNHPIVDVHTHAFNARYLPIKRVMRGRTWSTSFWWVPEFMLDVAAVVVTGTTPRNEAEARERAARIAEWERVNGTDGSDSTRLRAMLQTNRKVPRMVSVISGNSIVQKSSVRAI